MSTEIDRVWDIINNVGVCMLTTTFDGGLRARPLEARPDRKADRLLFIIDVQSAKREEIERWPDVGVAFVDVADKAYLSITGKAQILEDLELRRLAWRNSDAVGGLAVPTKTSAASIPAHSRKSNGSFEASCSSRARFL